MAPHIAAFASSVAPSVSVSTFASSARSVSARTTSFLPATPALHRNEQLPLAPRVQQPSMLFGLSRFFGKKELVALPQYDVSNKADRASDVIDQQSRYEWHHSYVGNAPMAKDVAPEQKPSLGWIEEIIKVLIPILQNEGANVVGAERSVLSAISTFVGPLLLQAATGRLTTSSIPEAFAAYKKSINARIEGDGRTIQEYKDQFSKYLPLDTVAKLDQFLRDDIFGWYRVAGPNPMKLRKLRVPYSDFFPSLTNEIYQGISGFTGDTLEAASLSGRLYYVEYSEFAGVKTGKDQDGNVKAGFVYAPRCLLAVPPVLSERATVLPIAIQCGQESSYPMYTSNGTHTDPVTWLAAKLTVQVSDAVLHEAVYHLGRTHLLTEVFICAMFRSMPDVHPLYRLMNQHFYGTININHAAINLLINDGGTIDQITAPDIRQTRDISAAATTDRSFSFNDWMPLKEMKERGVLNADVRYPYRDDVKELWPPLEEWVRSYITAYYKSDDDVKNDYELAAWCKEVAGLQNGSLRGFGENANGEIMTVNYLVECVTMIIFTASIQHAAVNFPQGTMMQFTPAMPLGGYAPAPQTAKPFSSFDDWVNKMMPNLERANTQLTTAEEIGVLRYTTLGEYKKKLNFAPEEVQDALDEFQEKLGEIGAKIQKRNKKERLAGLPVYNFLVPKNIPQSINI